MFARLPSLVRSVPILLAVASSLCGQAESVVPRLRDPVAMGMPGTSPAAATITTTPDGALLGLGDAYKCRFTAAGIEFIPALGEHAPHNMPVAIQVQAIGRGDVLRPVSAARRQQDALRVEYRRSEVIERYDVRAAGVEQSFVLDHLPQGTG